MKQALLVIDVQNDYFPKGKMPLDHPEEALKKINQLENMFLEKQLPIIYIQHIKKGGDAAFFKANTQGVRLHSELKKEETSIVIVKHFPNSFYQTNLKETLDTLNVKQLVICGMMTHMCIDSTTRASCELQFQPIVIHDATATKRLIREKKVVEAVEVQNAFLSALTTFATVTSTENFLHSTI